jgi:transcriptional regulator with XRE-family HTH domain
MIPRMERQPTANEQLRKAMAETHKSVEDVSRATGVSKKTVQRWLEGQVPRAHHRRTVAELVGKDERFLWPVEGTPKRVPPQHPEFSEVAQTARATQAQPWWQHVPVWLQALAALIAALGGLWILVDKPPDPSVTISSIRPQHHGNATTFIVTGTVQNMPDDSYVVLVGRPQSSQGSRVSTRTNSPAADLAASVRWFVSEPADVYHDGHWTAILRITAPSSDEVTVGAIVIDRDALGSRELSAAGPRSARVQGESATQSVAISSNLPVEFRDTCSRYEGEDTVLAGALVVFQCHSNSVARVRLGLFRSSDDLYTAYNRAVRVAGVKRDSGALLCRWNPGEGAWRYEGATEDRGRYLCYVDLRRNAWVHWTLDKEKIYAYAYRNDDNMKAIDDWWKSV